MCYAIPGKVVSVDGDTATLEYFGERKKASVIRNGGITPAAGGYAFAQGGIVVDVITESEAVPMLEAWKERFFELKRIDDGIANAKAEGKNDNGIFFKKIESGMLATRSDMEKVLAAGGADGGDAGALESLFSFANHVRAKALGNSCCVHGIIEFSSHCRNACAYCGLNKNNEKIKRYRMGPGEIVETAVHAARSLGFRALVLQSGEDAYYTDEMLAEIVRRIRERCGVLIFMSIGERPFESYKKLYGAGAYGVLLRFETSNPKLYAVMRPGKRLDGRLALIRRLITAKFVVATGFIVGLPGSTNQDLINDILLTKSLRPGMYSFGPLIPHPETALASAPRVPLSQALKAIAVARIADPDSKILATTALETLDRDGRRKGLLAGANSLMINLTPEAYRRDYEIYPGKAGNSGKTQDTIRDTLQLLHSLGRAPTDLER